MAKARAIDDSVSPGCTLYDPSPSDGAGSELGSGVVSGTTVSDGAGENVPPPGSPIVGVDVGVDAGAAQAETASSIARRLGSRARRIGLVRMEADVRRLHRGQGAVVKEACLALEKVELGTEATGRVGDLEQLLLP